METNKIKKVKVHKSRWSHEEQDCDYYFHQWLMDGGKTFCLCEDLETGQIFSFDISKYPITFIQEKRKNKTTAVWLRKGGISDEEYALKRKAYAKEYREKNKDKMKEYQRDYQKTYRKKDCSV